MSTVSFLAISRRAYGTASRPAAESLLARNTLFDVFFRGERAVQGPMSLELTADPLLVSGKAAVLLLLVTRVFG